MNGHRDITLYDTTLRDGMQREGLSVSVDEKMRIAFKLAELGMHVVEGGFPGSNPKDEEFFTRMEEEAAALGATRLAAFGMTRAKGVAAKDDAVLRVLADCWAPVSTIVGKTWDLHVKKVLRVDRAENLRMIAESIMFLCTQGKTVVYDAEHFFDGFAADTDYALECVRTAAEAGADTVVLCDTNGVSLPVNLGRVVGRVVDYLATLGLTCRVGIHGHNDTGCAVANTLIAVQKGATHVQGTVNGYGERCGNADLCAIIPALKLKMGFDCISDDRLQRLTDTSHYVAELCNISPDPHQPYVGRNAFAHKGGLHIAAVQEDHSTFEHIRPELVGNTPHILVSELAGKGTIRQRARELGYSLDDERKLEDRILRRVKKMEHQGYHYEAADASFELLMRDELGVRAEFFRLESFRIIVEKRENGAVMTEATIKLHVNGDRVITTAEGNGPVNALDKAIRQAIETKFPYLEDIRLVNYSVRILDEPAGTAAVTRVLLDSSDGSDSWGSVGVSDNVVEASWQALVDSINYGLMRKAPRETPESCE